MGYTERVMRFDTIDQIKAHEFVGNHAADGEAFQAIHEFVMDASRPMEERAEAIRQMEDRGMGCGRDQEGNDAVLVADYLSYVE